MRKLSAMILLFPVAVLFIGTVRLGSICPAQPAASCAKMETGGAAVGVCGKADGCCATGRCDAAGTGGCHRTNHQPKQKDGCTSCLECPLCALVTFSPEFRLEVVRHEKTTEYAVMPDNPLSDYFQRHWKPPDPSLFT